MHMESHAASRFPSNSPFGSKAKREDEQLITRLAIEQKLSRLCGMNKCFANSLSFTLSVCSPSPHSFWECV